MRRPFRTGCTTSSRWSSNWFAAHGKEPLWNSLLHPEHHYLGYQQPAGEHLEVPGVGAVGGRLPLPGMVLGPARHLRSRDRYIGWSAGRAAAVTLRFLAYNTRDF